VTSALGTWSGLTFNPNTGVIQGTPVDGGTNDIVIRGMPMAPAAILEISVTYAALPALAISMSPHLLSPYCGLYLHPAGYGHQFLDRNAVSRPPTNSGLCLEGTRTC